MPPRLPPRPRPQRMVELVHVLALVQVLGLGCVGVAAIVSFGWPAALAWVGVVLYLLGGQDWTA